MYKRQDYYYAFLPALLIVLREILVSGLRESISSYKISLEVTLLAKWKTTIQLFACGSFLVWRSNTFFYNIEILGLISYILLWIAGIITFITGALIATPILILAGISDYFDGFFARKYNVTSNFGKVLDPVADKLLVIGVIFALASENMFDYCLLYTSPSPRDPT